jgi:hypothetical protein
MTNKREKAREEHVSKTLPPLTIPKGCIMSEVIIFYSRLHSVENPLQT